MAVKIKDLNTGKIYPSKYAAFKDLNPEYRWNLSYSYQVKWLKHHPNLIICGAHPIQSHPSVYTIKTDNIQFDISLTAQKQQSEIKSSHTTISESTVNQDFAKIWGLEKMNLINECADFYTLYDLTIDHSDDEYIMSIFKSKRDHLSKQFASYLDMIIGGELRHCKNFGSFFQIKGSFRREGERHAVWSEWKNIRNQQGLNVLNKALECYKSGDWSTSFGGKAWAKVTEVLIRHIKGEDTETMFVDTVWSLQHNTTYILDKFWNINNLQKVLNLKFEGKIKELVNNGFCSSEVSQLWKEYNHVV